MSPSLLAPAPSSAEMSAQDFERFARLVQQASGIAMGEMKFELLRARIAKRLRALRMSSFKEYYELVTRDGQGGELDKMIDAVTTNKTEFFRESKHYEHLVSKLLQDFLASAEAKAGQPLRIWSAACSSGEEPYSLAMVLDQALGGRCPFKILATDISSRVLAKGMEGSYNLERMQGVPGSLKEKYFVPGQKDGEKIWTAGSLLRDSVLFSRFNLNEPSHYVFSKPFDAIFCRNVMIYFDRPTQESVVGSLSQHLKQGGYLYTGFSESLIGIRHNLKSAGASVYRKPRAWDNIS